MLLFLKVLATVLSIYSISFLFCGVALTVHAQSDLQTTKYRNMVIDLGNGLKTNASLNLPANGDGPMIMCIAMIVRATTLQWSILVGVIAGF